MNTVALLAALVLFGLTFTELVLYLATKKAPGRNPGAGEKA